MKFRSFVVLKFESHCGTFPLASYLLLPHQASLAESLPPIFPPRERKKNEKQQLH